MNSTGKNEPNAESIKNKIAEDGTTTKRSPILLLVLACVLVVCLMIGIQAFGILYSIAFPPVPTLPQNVVEVRHTEIDHGVDEWLYRTEQKACDVVQYYESIGGQCQVSKDSCSNATASETNFGTTGQHVATCVGEVQFSIFAYRWEANIADGYEYADGGTQFSLSREVFWTGAVPPRIDPRTGLEVGG